VSTKREQGQEDEAGRRLVIAYHPKDPENSAREALLIGGLSGHLWPRRRPGLTGLTLSEQQVLVLIFCNPEVRGPRAADWVGLDKASVRSVLSRLHAAELITLEAISDTKTEPRLTDKGRQQAEGLVNGLHDRLAALMGRDAGDILDLDDGDEDEEDEQQ
jgi:DNA-binding MarR family transcriptional regulator